MMENKDPKTVDLEAGSNAPAYETPSIETREAADLNSLLLDVNAFTGDPFEL
ncbi:MAG: hypothetical protein RLY93_18845 [Sumerlaeia bacterium]